MQVQSELMILEKLFGGVEAGGTKFVCCVASGPNKIVEEIRFATTTPDETLRKVVRFFQPYVTGGKVRTIGVGCFGPLDLEPGSPTYGYITATPKIHWSNTDVRGTLQRSLNIGIAIDSDVNAAAVGEHVWGASRGQDPSLYLTIGTGIGGGYLKDGKPLIGLQNLEMGHIRIPHNRELDPFEGSCPFHGDCFEGLASGPAIEERLGVTGAIVPVSDPFWDIEAEYIASALMNYILTLSPKKIILGGGVMQRGFLLPKIRNRVCVLLNDYVTSKTILENIDQYLVPPGLGNQSGSMGAVALAMQTEESNSDPLL
jgi:fructokinase